MQICLFLTFLSFYNLSPWSPCDCRPPGYGNIVHLYRLSCSMTGQWVQPVMTTAGRDVFISWCQALLNCRFTSHDPAPSHTQHIWRGSTLLLSSQCRSLFISVWALGVKKNEWDKRIFFLMNSSIKPPDLIRFVSADLKRSVDFLLCVIELSV